ncbi:Hcp family type VI secretion system effector [Nocardioides sp.]|uniref:Hcp family type VI secretion system effector n=1 Tax=Nocardioides sp. TaxID=35761 RepID=UPI003782D42C
MTGLFSSPSSRRAVLGGAVGAGLTGAAITGPPVSAATALRMASTRYTSTTTYLTITGIKGDSDDVDHPGAIEINDFTFGDDVQLSIGKGGTADTGKSTARPVRFSCLASQASPKLFLFCAQGRKLKTATLEVVGTPNGDGEPVAFFTAALENCVITSYDVSFASGDEGMRDEVELAYTRISYTYRYLNDSDTPVPVTIGWDFSTNKSF